MDSFLVNYQKQGDTILRSLKNKSTKKGKQYHYKCKNNEYNFQVKLCETKELLQISYNGKHNHSHQPKDIEGNDYWINLDLTCYRNLH